MRKYSYDKDFIRDVYPTLKKMGFTKEDITVLYNDFYADEARNNYNHHRHTVNYETGRIMIQKKHQRSPKEVEDLFDEIDNSADEDDFDTDEERLEAILFQDKSPTPGSSSNSSPVFTIYHALTSRQKEIIKYKYLGHSQTHIADYYGVSNAAISQQMKSIQKHFIPYCRENHLICS